MKSIIHRFAKAEIKFQDSNNNNCIILPVKKYYGSYMKSLLRALVILIVSILLLYLYGITHLYLLSIGVIVHGEEYIIASLVILSSILLFFILKFFKYTKEKEMSVLIQRNDKFYILPFDKFINEDYNLDDYILNGKIKAKRFAYTFEFKIREARIFSSFKLTHRYNGIKTSYSNNYFSCKELLDVQKSELLKNNIKYKNNRK